MGPEPFPHPRPQAGRETEGIGTQEPCALGPGDLLWEHESTLHWVMVISRTGQQGELEHSGRLRYQALVEDRPTLLGPLRPNTDAVVLKTCQQWEGCQRGEGWIELFLQEKGQVDDTSPAVPWRNSLSTLGRPRCSIPLAGSSAPGDSLCTSHVPAHLVHQHQTLLPGSRERLSHLGHVSAQLERQLQGASLKSSFLPTGGQTCAECLTAARGHLCKPLQQLCTTAHDWLPPPWQGSSAGLGLCIPSQRGIRRCCCVPRHPPAMWLATTAMCPWALQLGDLLLLQDHTSTVRLVLRLLHPPH